MTVPSPDRLRAWLLRWTALTTLIFWLGLTGRGIAGDYWFPLVGSAAFLVIFWWGWRRGPRVPLYVALGTWHAALAAGAAYLAVTQPEDFRFQGDTLGVDVSLALVGPVLFGGGAAAAMYWIYRDRRTPTGPPPPWAARNRRWVLGLVALLPLQFALLRFGPPQSLADQLGVVLAIVQWLLVGRAIRPGAATA
jgi:hypothetical protein